MNPETTKTLDVIAAQGRRAAVNFSKVARQMILAGIGEGEAWQLFLAEYLKEALEEAKGNQCRAAKLLKIHRNTLRRQMDELKLNGFKNRRKPARTYREERGEKQFA